MFPRPELGISLSSAEDQMGYTDLLKHRLVLTTYTPIAQPYRRISPSQLREVRDHYILGKLLSQDIIAPSSSPHAAPIVLVPRKSGELKMCCDYRKLNSFTEKKCFPYNQNRGIHRCTKRSQIFIHS